MSNLKKKSIIILIISIILIVFFGFQYHRGIKAISLYKVYLDGEVIGIIESKEALEDYIDSQNTKYKEEYKADKIYSPNGLEIKTVSTYSKSIDTIEDVYKKILQKEPFTISGYEFNIKKDDKTITIYTLKEETFKNAVNNIIETLVGKEDYEKYLQKTQAQITTTGSIIEDIYVEENITVKQTNISVAETIYLDESELSKYLLFGTTEAQKTYTVKEGDTIEEVVFNNKISVEEFLISNPLFTSSENLLYPGQVVTIGITDPQISVAVEEYVVEDKTVKYQTEYQYDPDKNKYYEQKLQSGVNGLERVSQRTKTVNGIIEAVESISKEELQPAINEIVLKGQKEVTGIGDTKNWLWPTNSGWTITSGWTYRINPISGEREIHKAIDIAGTGYGSPIYAVTNGVVSEVATRTQDGNYVCINHNNGYYTCYAHMARQNVKVGEIVERGDIIGFMGHTGWATGTHVHFEVWIGGKPWMGGHRINPWTMYR